MAVVTVLFSWLFIITWPCILLLLYTMFCNKLRFVLQTLFILPMAIITSIICYIFGLIIKYLTFSFISCSVRIYLLSLITHNFWQYMLFTFEFWANIRYVVSDEYVNDDIFYLNNNNLIILSNHSESPFDWITIASFSDYLNRLHHSFIFMKKEFIYVPAIGWIGSLLSAIPLKRDWNSDASMIKKLCFKFKLNIDYKYVTPWIWCIYPEGTRFNLNKLNDAQKFAKKRGFPIYHNILQPRVKGFSSLTFNLYEVLGSIIDITVLYDPYPPKTINFFINTRLSKYTHIHLRVYRQNKIPYNQNKLNQWLRDRWTEKDKIIQKMKQKQIKYRILNRSPWKAIRYYSIWTIFIIYLLFKLIFKSGFIMFNLLLIAALFPVVIVSIETSQNFNVNHN